VFFANKKKTIIFFPVPFRIFPFPFSVLLRPTLTLAARLNADSRRSPTTASTQTPRPKLTHTSEDQHGKGAERRNTRHVSSSSSSFKKEEGDFDEEEGDASPEDLCSHHQGNRSCCSGTGKEDCSDKEEGRDSGWWWPLPYGSVSTLAC
jgi:hypothetical protein